ncbi:hypothetical protein PAMP_011651 [Pampus punctatissimus]
MKEWIEEEEEVQEEEEEAAGAQQLQKKDSQLKALDAFYKEQLAQLEKRADRFSEGSDGSRRSHMGQP